MMGVSTRRVPVSALAVVLGVFGGERCGLEWDRVGYVCHRRGIFTAVNIEWAGGEVSVDGQRVSLLSSLTHPSKGGDLTSSLPTLWLSSGLMAS